ncbi:Mitochondrial copper homeostasis protein [Linnemannia zychae]|nr:Mitochondrial copper homeostasis protein [Linnemannia zychae]
MASEPTTAAADGNHDQTQKTSPSEPQGIPRRIRKHTRIVTSDEEMKEFNKGYYQKAQSQYMDPCHAQTMASLKCMDQNGYDKKKCTHFFKDYSDCKRKWLATLRDDRRKRNMGISEDDDQSQDKKESPNASTSL